MWPSQDFLLSEEKDLDENVVDPCKESSINVSGVENVGVGEVIDIGWFSSLETLLRVTGYVMRFVRNLKKVSNKGEGINGESLLEEVENTKLLWVKYEQSFIKNSLNYEKLKNSLLLFADNENILHCRSRLAEAKRLDFDSKNLILLRNYSRFTELTVLSFHQVVKHNCVETTLCRLRDVYWIIRGRQRVKSILRKCATCRLIQGKTITITETPALPSYRVCCNHAFENVGLDFAGPLYCRDDFSSTKNMYKCYFFYFLHVALHEQYIWK